MPSSRELAVPFDLRTALDGGRLQDDEGIICGSPPRTPLKTLLSMTIAGSLTAWGTPAAAYVAQILTSIPAQAGEGDRLEDRLKAAVDDVLEHAIAFVPAVVDVRDARVVGDRIYTLLLIADDDGATLVKALSEGNRDEL